MRVIIPSLRKLISWWLDIFSVDRRTMVFINMYSILLSLTSSVLRNFVVFFAGTAQNGISCRPYKQFTDKTGELNNNCLIETLVETQVRAKRRSANCDWQRKWRTVEAEGSRKEASCQP